MGGCLGFTNFGQNSQIDQSKGNKNGQQAKRLLPISLTINH
jgi:hypothetical protein